MENWEEQLFMRHLIQLENQYKTCPNPIIKLKILREVLFLRRLFLDKDSP